MFFQQKEANWRTEFSAEYQHDLSKDLHDLVVMQFPKSKAELAFTLAMINQSLSENCQLYFVGEKNSGVNSVLKLAKNYIAEGSKVDNARHCLLFSGTFNNHKHPFHLNDCFSQYTVDTNNTPLKIAALPGVFSQNKLDVGTELLLQHLPPFKGNILDFGCGAGVIAAFIGDRNKECSLSLLDVNILAIESAKKTLALNKLSGNVFASNSLSNVTDKYDFVITNPPFHQGIKTNYAATENFFKHISACLHHNGQVIVVANSFLQYQGLMEQYIGKTIRLVESKGFTIYHCKK